LLALVALSGIPVGGGRRLMVLRGPVVLLDDRKEESERDMMASRRTFGIAENDIIGNVDESSSEVIVDVWHLGTLIYKPYLC
jgi:hypothetical protein